MSEREFELYLSLMSKLLRLGPEQRHAIADELRDHFDERFAALCRQGVPRDEAIRQALDEFGDAAALAADFTQLARTRRRRLIMRCTLATAFVGAAALFLIRALSLPDPHFAGPQLVQAQDEEGAPPQTLEVPPPAKPTSIDPAKIVPPPLAHRLTWKFADLPLNEMLAELSRTIGMPILIDEVEFNNVGLSSEKPVSDVMSDFPAYLLLERHAGQHDLSWYVDDGIIVVTSEERADTRLTLRSHVVTDLRDAGYDPNGLANVFMNLTEGPWEQLDGIGGTLTRVGDVIFVRQSDRMHRQVAGLLEAFRHHARETYVDCPPSHEAVREKLREPVSVEFVDVPLETAAARLSEETGLDIHIDAAELANVGIPTDQPVNLILTEKPLGTVLKYLLSPLSLTAIPHLGRLSITTTEKAEITLQIVVHDVSDVCHSKEETELLSNAVINETQGPWEQIDGIGGKIGVPASGILVVRQTERVLKEVRELLAAYRQAMALSGPDPADAAELEKIETRFYRMNADTARDLRNVIPMFVRPGTWYGGSVDSNPIGTITTVAIDSRIRELSGRNVTNKQPEPEQEQPEEPAAAQQADVLVIPQAVLIIKHTKATHQEIDRFLRKIRGDDPTHPGFGPTAPPEILFKGLDNMGGGLGGLGGGFF